MRVLLRYHLRHFLMHLNRGEGGDGQLELDAPLPNTEPDVDVPTDVARSNADARADSNAFPDDIHSCADAVSELAER